MFIPIKTVLPAISVVMVVVAMIGWRVCRNRENQFGEAAFVTLYGAGALLCGYAMGLPA